MMERTGMEQWRDRYEAVEAVQDELRILGERGLASLSDEQVAERIESVLVKKYGAWPGNCNPVQVEFIRACVISTAERIAWWKVLEEEGIDIGG